MTIQSKNCDNSDCNGRGSAEFNRYCGAYICHRCDTHVGLARCFCGWARDGGNGRHQLEDMGETIEPEPEIGPAFEFTESPRGYEARNRWAEGYDDLNGAPEGEWDR